MSANSAMPTVEKSPEDATTRTAPRGVPAEGSPAPNGDEVQVGEADNITYLAGLQFIVLSSVFVSHFCHQTRLFV